MRRTSRNRLHKGFGLCNHEGMTETTNTQPTAIIYVRVSSAMQVEEGASLTAQEQTLIRLAEERGLRTVVISDPGVSAKDMNRPGIQRALQMLEDGEAHYLFAVAIDRISRSVADFSTLMESARRQGWGFVLPGQDLDTTTSAGELMAHMQISFAQYERRRIGERTALGMAQRKAEGVHIGRKRALPDDVARRIFQMKDDGMTVAAIARTLTEEEVPTATGRTKWHSSTVNRVLTSVTGRPD